MSGKGICYDNSMVETFFKSIKAKLIWRNKWDTGGQAEGAIFQYINGFYNPRRRHSSRERFQFSLKQGYRQCPESAEGVAGYWRSNINWKRFKMKTQMLGRRSGRTSYGAGGGNRTRVISLEDLLPVSD